MGEVMAPGPGGSPFRARWDATSVSLYSVVNEPGGIFSLTLYSTLFSGLIARQWELFFRESPLTLYSTLFCGLSEKFFKKTSSPCIPHFFQVLQPVGGNFFSGKVPLTLYSTLFSRLDEKIIKLFLRKDGRHSLDFANRIRKTSFTKSFFGQRKSRKRKPDRLIPVGALGK